MPNISESDIPQVNVSPSVPVKHGNPFVKILIGLLLLGIGVGGGLFLANNKAKIPFLSKQVVTTYEDCIKAKGSTIQESYPATCVTRDGARFTQPLTEEEQQNLLPPDWDNEQANSLNTANWETYSSLRYKYSFQYPGTWFFSPYKEDDPTVLGGSHVITSYSVDSVESYMDHGIVNWKKFIGDDPAFKIDFGTYDATQAASSIEEAKKKGNKQVKSDLQINNLDTTQYEVIDTLSGDTVQYYVAYPDKTRVVTVVLYVKNSVGKNYQSSNLWSELKQILSTFKFENQASIATPVSQPLLTKISGILSTTDWKVVSNNGITFKIPSYANCDNDTLCTVVSYPNYYQGTLLPVPSRISVSVTTYLGGSRRQQYLDENKGVADCKPIYLDALFGTVNALQIAIDGGWCQGGYAGGIVSVVGNKLVVVGFGLTYNDKKEISRWDVRDTLVSTLSFQ